MEPKKNPKVNVSRNSSLYFAIGLNIMLLLTYLALEYKTYETKAVTVNLLNIDEQIEEDVPITTIELPPLPPPKQVVSEIITIVEDVEDIEETVVESTEIGQDDVIEERVVGVEEIIIDDVEEDIDVPFAVIEKVPIFPGCQGNNEALKTCFQKKITEHIQKHFKYPEVAKDLNIQGRVFIYFLIDKNGNITNIKSRGPDKLLETEAERIISLLPKMIPGRQRDNNVNVPYNIPLNFKLDTQ